MAEILNNSEYDNKIEHRLNQMSVIFLSICFVLFELIFLLRFIGFLSKSDFVTKFACGNLDAKFSTVTLLNSGVVMYLSWLWSVIFFLISLIFVLWSVFLTKLLTLWFLFSTALRAVVVTKLVILGISPLTSFVLALRVVLVAKLVMSGIWS